MIAQLKETIDAKAAEAAAAFKAAATDKDVEVAVGRFAGLAVPINTEGLAASLRVSGLNGTPYAQWGPMQDAWDQLFPGFPGEKIVLGVLERSTMWNYSDPEPVVMMGRADRYIYIFVSGRLYWVAMSLADFLENGPRFDMLFRDYYPYSKEENPRLAKIDEAIMVAARQNALPGEGSFERTESFLRLISPSHPPSYTKYPWCILW